MEVSKISIQSITDKQLEFLRYVHERSCEDINFLRNTTRNNVCKSYSLRYNIHIRTVESLYQRLYKNNILLVNYLRRGNNARCDVRINYAHPGIPDDMRAAMPESEREFFKKLSDRLEKAKKEDEKAYIDYSNNTIVKPSLSPTEATEPTVEEPKSQDVVAPVKVMRNKDSLNLTITINLNI